MDLEYRHANVITRALGRYLRVIDHDQLLGLIVINPWVWDFSVQSGAITVRSWSEGRSSTAEDVLIRLFAGALHNIRNGGSSCVAEWMVDSLIEGKGADLQRTVGALRDLDDLLSPQHTPKKTVWRADMGPVYNKPDLVAKFESALRKSIGRGPEVAFAMLVLCLALIEVLIAWAPFETLLRSEGLVSQLWDARETGSPQKLPRGLEFFSTDRQALVMAWTDRKTSLLSIVSSDEEGMGVS
jgi:hypothetical protein